jgi:hypothetical protein
LKLNLSFLKTLWQNIVLASKSKIAIFLYGVILTFCTHLPSDLANIATFGTYLSSNGINDPFIRPVLTRVFGQANQTKPNSSLSSKDEELYGDCLTQYYGDFEYFPDIPKYIEISQENKKKTRLSLMLEMKQELSKNVQTGFKSLSQAKASWRLIHGIDYFREIYTYLSYSYMPCQKQIFNKKVQKFLNDFELYFDEKCELTKDSDYIEGNGSGIHYTLLLLKEYDQLILTTLNEQELGNPKFKTFKKEWDAIKIDPYES